MPFYVGAATSGLTAVSKNAAYNANPGEMVLADAVGGAFTITLPAPTFPGTVVGVKKVDAGYNAVTVSCATATIDNDTNATLASPNVGATFVADGTAWRISSTTLLGTSSAASGSTSDAAIAPPYFSGNWYDRRLGLGGPVSNLVNSGFATTSTIYYLAAYQHRAVAIDQVGYLVSAQAAPTSGAAVRIGAYTMAAGGAPGTLIADFGLLNLGISAGVFLTLTGLSATLPKGWIYFALSFNGTSPAQSMGIQQFGSGMYQSGVPTASMTSSYLLNGGALPGPAYYSQTGNSTASALAATAAGATAQYPSTYAYPTCVFYRAA